MRAWDQSLAVHNVVPGVGRAVLYTQLRHSRTRADAAARMKQGLLGGKGGRRREVTRLSHVKAARPQGGAVPNVEREERAMLIVAGQVSQWQAVGESYFRLLCRRC